MAFGRMPIPHVVHIDVPQPAPSTTVVMPTSFVMTLAVVPTINPSQDANGGSDADLGKCWRYVGIDIEPIDSDALDEASSDDENDPPNKRNIAGRVSLDEIQQYDSPLLKRGKGVTYIKNIGGCDTPINGKGILRAKPHPKVNAVMGPFNIQATGPKHGLDPNMWCEYKPFIFALFQSFFHKVETMISLGGFQLLLVFLTELLLAFSFR